MTILSEKTDIVKNVTEADKLFEELGYEKKYEDLTEV